MTFIHIDLPQWQWLAFRRSITLDAARRAGSGKPVLVRVRFTRLLFAMLAVIGLIVGPFAPRAALAAADMTAAAAGESAIDMPDGMPCCPPAEKKADCAKDCPFMAACAGMAFAPANGVALAVPVALLAVIAPEDDAKRQGVAQGPPARPPKA